MNTDIAIEKIKKYVNDAFTRINVKIGENIYRGHRRVLSSEIEDSISLFVLDILPKGYKVFLDATVRVGNKMNRPDLLLVNEYNKVIAMIEIKSNMGWCRNASVVIDGIKDNHRRYTIAGNIKCKFSNESTQTVKYSDVVRLYLVSFTDGNSSQANHNRNKEYANSQDIHQFNLFSGWYGNLKNCEIDDFANSLLSIE